MFTLILTLLLSDGSIREVNLNTEAPSQHVCMMDMQTMAKYMGDHPDRKLVKWHCEDVKKIRTSI